MATESFRFMSVRPPQRLSREQASLLTVRAYETPPSPFHQALIRARASADPRKTISGMVSDYLHPAHGGKSSFVGDLGALPEPLGELDEWLLNIGSENVSAASVAAALNRIAGQTAAQIVAGVGYAGLRERVTDSVIAITIIPQPSAQHRGLLIRAIRIMGLLERMASSPQSSRGIVAALSAIVLLPTDLFPLPAPVAASPSRGGKKQSPAAKRRRKAFSRLANELGDLKIALPELTAALSSEIEKRQSNADTSPSEGLPIEGNASAFRLSRATALALSSRTKAVLDRLNLPLTSIDVPTATRAIERRMTEVGATLFRPSPSKRSFRFGSSLIPSGSVARSDVASIADTFFDLSIPGPCVSGTSTEPNSGELAVGVGSARISGIADLMVVEQQILRYEMGEIAHVENVLEGETKKRKHQRMQTTEVTLFTETERTTETTRDLESTDRFELETENQTTIAQDASRQAGVTISASYGPSVEATLNANVTSDSSKQESARSASSYAHDVTSRSVSRLQDRELVRRYRRTVDETQEVDHHTLDNGGPGHVIGVYRWLDKIYRAQVMNYGRRLLLEFTIPEPAAFLKYAQTANTDSRTVSLEEPDTPGYCVDGNFVPLAPQDVQRENYLFWAGKYGVDIDPPPALQVVIGTTINESNLTNASAKAITTGFDVPPGYVARIGYRTNGLMTVRKGKEAIARLDVEVGRNSMTTGSTATLNSETVLPVGAHARGMLAYTVNVEMLCELTAEGFEAWQIDAYMRIMNGYRELRAKYEEQIAQMRVETLPEIRGQNPLLNREVERTELKKWSISLLLGNHVDQFSGMTSTAQGAPVLNLPVAAEEGRFIQFLEQAFEWVHMTYVLYPYFWGRDEQWPDLIAAADQDPLFQRFLQAGAARVVVPVRRNYEELVTNFVALNGQGDPWGASGPPQIDDETGLYVSIVEEIREQANAESQDRVGTVSVTAGSNIAITTRPEFVSGSDVDRRILIDDRPYRISRVTSSTRVELAEPFRGATDAAARYALGAIYVGVPWQVKIPSSLVILQGNSVLPDWS